MNPISNLSDKKFKELDYNELMQVIFAYCDQNKYFDVMAVFGGFGELPRVQCNRPNLEATFERTVGDIYLLKCFFKYWNR